MAMGKSSNRNDHYKLKSPVTGRERKPMVDVRYVGLPTFMRAPFASSLEGLDIGLVGVPLDTGVTNRPGARHGPREIRNQSSNMRTIHPVTRLSPYDLCTVADVGDVAFEYLYDLEKAHVEIEAFFGHLQEAGVTPLTAGGDHSITYPILKGIVREEPIGLIQIDAHTDTWGEFKGSRSHHGAPFRRAVEDGLIDPKRTVQIGIRGAQNITDGWDYSQEVGMTVIFMHEFAQMGIEEVISAARQVVGDAPVYISFDIDSLDPAFAPGTGTPEVGGLTTLEAQTLLRGLRGLQLVGADVVEVSPPFDPSGNTALVGATMMYEILCLLSESVAENSSRGRPTSTDL
jgi:guanidinopropionase